MRSFGIVVRSRERSFCSDTRQCQFGIRTHLVLDCMGIYECCLKLSLLVLVAWIFRQDSPLFIVLRRIRKTWLPCCWGNLHHCSCRQQSAKGENHCIVLCLCLNHVEEARRRGFLMGACSARCENVFSSFLYQSEAGRSRVFETPLEFIFLRL